MERNANYALVGFISLVTLVALVAFVVWIGRYSFNRDFDIYEIVFDGPVRGLTKGAEVQFSGIKVGDVTDLRLHAANPNKVVARIQINSDVPVKTDSYATLEPQGITFVSIVQITGGSPDARLLKEVAPTDPPQIRSQTSALSELLAGGGTVLQEAMEALDRVNQVLSDRNIANFSATLEDINVISAAARDSAGVFADAQAALQSVDQTAKEFTALANSSQKLVDEDARKLLAEADAAVKQVQAAAAEAQAAINGIRGPTTDFATNALPQAQSAIISLQGAAEALERLVNEIESDPRQLITKEPARKIEVAP